MNNWCVDEYTALIACGAFLFMIGRMEWLDYRDRAKREEWNELTRLRDRYAPGKNEEERERRRLQELEAKWSKES